MLMAYVAIQHSGKAPESFSLWSKHETLHRGRPTQKELKKYPQHIRAPGGRHLEIQYGRHFGPIFSYNSKTKAGRNILFVANPPF